MLQLSSVSWTTACEVRPTSGQSSTRRRTRSGNAQDLEGLDDLFTGDTYDHVGQRRGVAWWKEVFTFLYATLPDWRWTLEDLVADQDRVVARLTVRGTHQGSVIPFLHGIPPTGRPVEWTHHHTFRFVDGKIAEHWANRDDLGFLRQVQG